MHKRITAVLILISLLGTLAVLFIASLEQTPRSIANITSKTPQASITADIIYQKNYSSYSYLLLKDQTGNISAICFSCPLFNKSKTYEFSGKITQYKGSLQLQIDSAKAK